VAFFALLGCHAELTVDQAIAKEAPLVDAKLTAIATIAKRLPELDRGQRYGGPALQQPPVLDSDKKEGKTGNALAVYASDLANLEDLAHAQKIFERAFILDDAVGCYSIIRNHVAVSEDLNHLGFKIESGDIKPFRPHIACELLEVVSYLAVIEPSHTESAVSMGSGKYAEGEASGTVFVVELPSGRYLGTRQYRTEHLGGVQVEFDAKDGAMERGMAASDAVRSAFKNAITTAIWKSLANAPGNPSPPAQ
jgi:hypothetical protein